MKKYIIKSLKCAGVLLAIMLMLPMGAIATRQLSAVELEKEKVNRNLPDYLENTILNGNYKVVITEDGKPPMDLLNYDYCISYKDMEKICKVARQVYNWSYNLDPYPLEVASTNEEYIPDYYEDAIPCYDGSPHQISGKIRLKVFFAKDFYHKPNNIANLQSLINKGWQRFIRFAVVPVTVEYYTGIWDASNCPVYDTEQCLYDLDQDCHSYQTADNILVMGWIKLGDHNGRANLPGFFSVGAESVLVLNHPKDSIVQHEISHNFNCPEGGWWPWEHNYQSCVMNYWYCFIHSTVWCNSCYNKIFNRIWSG
ncbi:Uncharacterised protein [uncultured archaeon]|nr:Uncharacterised protein [uncultured archaeon]